MSTFRRTLLALPLLMSCWSCSKVYINEIYRSPSCPADNLHSQDAHLVGVNHVNVLEFKRSFDGLFGSDSAFNQRLMQSIAERLRSRTNRSIELDASHESSLLNLQSLQPGAQDSARSFLKGLPKSYLVSLSDYTVTNSYNTVTTYSARTGSSQSSQEVCIVAFTVQVWDTRKSEKVLEFRSVGSKPVTLFFYETALDAAVDEAIDHSVGFLVDGTKEF